MWLVKRKWRLWQLSSAKPAWKWDSQWSWTEAFFSLGSALRSALCVVNFQIKKEDKIKRKPLGPGYQIFNISYFPQFNLSFEKKYLFLKMHKNHPKVYTKSPNSGYGYKGRDLALLETWARYWQKGHVKRRQNSLHVYSARFQWTTTRKFKLSII